ncbi:MAG: TPM domain-containing protein [Candidatus Riflebacteria bacterium]|nr:TPM domain-containing protein [Candidatus Riflebacteria bacterium]
MKCPQCEAYMNDCTPICSGCGFNITEFDKVLQIPTERTGLIMDWAEAISSEGLDRINTRLQSFCETTDMDYCLVTVSTSAPRSPREFVYWLFNRWQIGGENHLGVLVLLAMNERRIEVEVGHNLEKYISDDEAGGVLEHHAVPFLKKGDIDNGLYHSLDMLGKIIEHGVAEEKQNEKAN